MSSVDIYIVGTYFVLAIAVGLLLRKSAGQGVTAYFLGGRKIPWWVMGMSGTASNFDMTGTMVIISFIFAIGLQGFWVSMRGGMCLPLGILMVFMGKWLRRSNVITTAEWMELRFGKKRDGQAARLLSAVSNLIVTMAFLIYFVKGTGKFLSVFLPFSPEVCSILMIAIALVYTTLSGFRGVIYTDVLQEILILAASLFVGVKAFTLPEHAEILSYAGSDWASFMPHFEAQPMTWLADPGVYRLFGICILFWVLRGVFEGAGGFTGGYMAQRYYAVKSERDAGLMTAEWIVLLFFRWALIVGAALLALSIAKNNPAVAALLKADPEMALPTVISQAIPAGLRGLMVAGLIAAAMSTFDSTINAGAAYWVNDIYLCHLKPNAPIKLQMRQSYLATIVLAVVSVGLGLCIHNINEIWSWITGPLSAGLFAPIILRWYWWRFNGYGFAISTAVGLIASIALKLAAPNMALFFSFPLVWGCSLIGGILGSLATPQTNAAVLEAFWQKVRPFGWWKRVAENRAFDLLSCFLAVAWHLSGVVVMISLILHKWTVAISGALMVTLLSVTLYYTWYKNLQTPLEAMREQAHEE